MSGPIIVPLRPRKDGTQVRLVVGARDFYENVNGPAVFVRYEFFSPFMGEWRLKNEFAVHAGDAVDVVDAINQAEEMVLDRDSISEPPAWIKVGVHVDYHGVIGGPVTLANAVVRSGPHRMGDHWSVWLEGKASCVDVEACTPAKAATK